MLTYTPDKCRGGTLPKRRCWVIRRALLQPVSRNSSSKSRNTVEGSRKTIPNDEQALDPQFRLQLESTYEALESGRSPEAPYLDPPTDNNTAGITLQDVAGSNTSVFAGSFFRDYHESLIRDPDALPRFLLMGTGAAMASNRLSHFFDLRGPSMSVDTGCSTTLTALHQGCQSLRTGESNMSIVGGANVMFNPDMFLAMSSMT
jgi:acyl transferase domain-containing protein